MLETALSSTMVWAESADENDHWVYYSDPNLQQKQSLLSYERSDNRSEPSVHVNELSNNNNNNWKNREVKIMLSKKKLGELLGKMKMEDLHNIPVNQLLDRLIDSSDRFEGNERGGGYGAGVRGGDRQQMAVRKEDGGNCATLTDSIRLV
ncbi:hypothetical protein R6Q59_006070 [Mikania micrantha]